MLYAKLTTLKDVKVMNDERLTQELKQFLSKHGADLVGVGSVERWKNAPADVKPNVYLPEAKYVIAFASHIPNGVCDVWGTYDDPPGKTAGPYMVYGHITQDLELVRLANLGAKWLERHGYKSVIFPNTFMPSCYRKAEEFFSDFSHRHAAVACGLGEFGLSGLLLTPQFGARQRVNSIITDAPLIENSMYDGPPLCSIDECKKRFGVPCIKDCPTGAIGKFGKGIKVRIGDKTYKYRLVNKILCEWGKSLLKAGGTRRDIPPPMSWEELAELNWTDFSKAVKIHDEYFKKLDSVDLSMYKGYGHAEFCGICCHRCSAINFIRERELDTNP